MKQTPLSRLVMAALFAALTCIATLVIQLRVAPTGGYVNLGDCGVLLSAWLLSTPYAVAAAAVASALADLVAGYAYYAPATLVIKALMALLGMIGNAVQAVCGIVSATAVYTLLRRSRALDARLDQLRK